MSVDAFVVWMTLVCFFPAAVLLAANAFRYRGPALYLSAFLLSWRINFPGIETIWVSLGGASAIALLGIVITRALWRKENVWGFADLWPLMILFATLLSALVSDDPLGGYQYVVQPQIWGVVFYYAVAGNIRSVGQLLKVLHAVIGGAIAISALGVADLLTQGRVQNLFTEWGILSFVPLGIRPGYNIGSSFNPDYFASLLSYSLMIAFALVLCRARRWGLFVPVVLFLLVSQLLSGGRSALLGSLAAGAIAWALCVQKYARKSDLILGLLAVMVVVGAIGYYVQGYQSSAGVPDTFEFVSKLRIEPNIMRIRLGFWSEAWRYFLLRPVLGYGRAPLLYSFGGTAHAHSFYLQTLLNTGVLGLFVWLGMIASTLWSLTGLWRSESDLSRAAPILGIMCGLLAFLIDGLFNEPTLLDPPVAAMLWSLLGLAARVRWLVLSRAGERRDTSVVTQQVAWGMADRLGRPILVTMLAFIGVLASLAIMHFEHLSDTFMVLLALSVLPFGFWASSRIRSTKQPRT